MGNKSTTVWIVKEWYAWPFAWILAGRNYVHNMGEFIAKIIQPAYAYGGYSDLHILSHGNHKVHKATGITFGHWIDMGGGDRLGEGDLSEEDGLLYLQPSSKTRLFINKIAEVLRPDATITFSACGQGDGRLLKIISYYLGNGITVSGYSGLGHPFGRGNIAFRNGLRV